MAVSDAAARTRVFFFSALLRIRVWVETATTTISDYVVRTWVCRAELCGVPYVSLWPLFDTEFVPGRRSAVA